MRTILFLILMLSLLVACQSREPGPFEKAGQKADEMKENAEEGKPLLHKRGTLEETGKAIDETLTGSSSSR